MRRWPVLAALWLLVVGTLVIVSQAVAFLVAGALSPELVTVGGGMIASAWAVVKDWPPGGPPTGDSPRSESSPSPSS